MYPVAKDMDRLVYYADLPISLYSDADIRYIKGLLQDTRGLIAEGAELTLYSSCKYIVCEVEKECQKLYLCGFKSKEVIEGVRRSYYKYARKCLSQYINEYKTGDMEEYISERLNDLYGSLVKVKNCTAVA